MKKKNINPPQLKRSTNRCSTRKVRRNFLLFQELNAFSTLSPFSSERELPTFAKAIFFLVARARARDILFSSSFRHLRES